MSTPLVTSPRVAGLTSSTAHLRQGLRREATTLLAGGAVKQVPGHFLSHPRRATQLALLPPTSYVLSGAVAGSRTLAHPRTSAKADAVRFAQECAHPRQPSWGH